MLKWSLCLVVASVLVWGCGDDSTDADSGVSSDACASDACIMDGGVDADSAAPDAAPDAASDATTDAPDASDAAVPEGLIASNVCDAAGVAVAHDGARVAWVSCDATPPALLSATLDGSEAVMVATDVGDATVEFTIDDGHLTFGAAGTLSVAPADGSAAPMALSSGTVDDHRSFMARVSSTSFSPRLMVLETEGTERRVVVRGLEDGYVATTTIVDDPTLSGDLGLISASGRVLVAAVEEASAPTYLKVRTDASMPSRVMPFGPMDYVMGPVGLGDTHNFAIEGDRLIRIRLDSGDIAELVPSGGGLLADYAQIIEREEAPGRKHIYFIANGDPQRRIRDATEATEVLATGDAIMQRMTPDRTSLVFASTTTLSSVPAEGGSAAVPIAHDVGTLDAIVAVSPDSTEVVVTLVDGGLVRASIGMEDQFQQIAGPLTQPGYAAEGGRVLWLRDGVLESLPGGDATAASIATSVVAWWPLPGSADVLYLNSEGALFQVASGG